MTQQLVRTPTGEEAMTQLGVTADLLTDEERRHLDENGFVVLENVLDQPTLEYVQQTLAEMSRRQHPETATDSELHELATLYIRINNRSIEQYAAELEMSEEAVNQRIAEMRADLETLETALAGDDIETIRKALMEGYRGSSIRAPDFMFDVFEFDPVFDLPLRTPRVLAAVTHVLGPEIHLKGIVCRWPRAGHGEQDLHRYPGGRAEQVMCVWLFDDMNLDNGPTRMVPGTHVLDHGPGHELNGDVRARHPREIKITGKAGSVLVFDDRIYHGGTTHNGGGPRRTLQSWFTRRDLFKGFLQLKRKEETLARLNPAQVWLLDLQEPPSANDAAD